MRSCIQLPYGLGYLRAALKQPPPKTLVVSTKNPTIHRSPTPETRSAEVVQPRKSAAPSMRRSSGVSKTRAPARTKSPEAKRKKHGVSGRANEVAHLTKATLATPLLRDLASNEREAFWIEIPVAVSIPTGDGSTSPVIDGRVDLIYRLPDGSLGIADFKTDRTFNRSIAEMAEPYEPQLGAYAYAVQKATGIEVTEASILFSRLAADKLGDGEYRLPNVQSAIELALKLASNR